MHHKHFFCHHQAEHPSNRQVDIHRASQVQEMLKYELVMDNQLLLVVTLYPLCFVYRLNKQWILAPPTLPLAAKASLFQFFQLHRRSKSPSLLSPDARRASGLSSPDECGRGSYTNGNGFLRLP